MGQGTASKHLASDPDPRPQGDDHNQQEDTHLAGQRQAHAETHGYIGTPSLALCHVERKPDGQSDKEGQEGVHRKIVRALDIHHGQGQQERGNEAHPPVKQPASQEKQQQHRTQIEQS